MPAFKQGRRDFYAERRKRLDRIAKHQGKAAMLRAMVEEYETIDSDEARAEVRRLKARVRTLQQMVLYMNVSPELDE